MRLEQIKLSSNVIDLQTSFVESPIINTFHNIETWRAEEVLAFGLGACLYLAYYVVSNYLNYKIKD